MHWSSSSSSESRACVRTRTDGRRSRRVAMTARCRRRDATVQFHTTRFVRRRSTRADSLPAQRPVMAIDPYASSADEWSLRSLLLQRVATVDTSNALGACGRVGVWACGRVSVCSACKWSSRRAARFGPKRMKSSVDLPPVRRSAAVRVVEAWLEVLEQSSESRKASNTFTHQHICAHEARVRAYMARLAWLPQVGPVYR